MAKSRKLTLDQAARKLTAIAVRHLDTLPPDEREKRIAAFETVISTGTRKKRAKPSKTLRTPKIRASARAR
jgi:hypothetical protein